MSRQTLSLPMSQIIASDAPLLSPVLTAADSPWEHQAPSNPDSYSYSYYNLPSPPRSIGSTCTDSPKSTSGMLKARMSPDSTAESEQLCVPTHQVFDIPVESIPPSPLSSSSPPSPQLPRLSISINPNMACAKRTATHAASSTKKPRASGDRVTSKEFVPPDVSGLSKREARLVKNRAAAFLSRQRKREEFELMEVRVAELEEENGRLLALSQNGNTPSRPNNEPEERLLTEIEQLRAQLAAAEKRERELHAKLERTTTRDTPMKTESVEPELHSKSGSVSSPCRSGAGLGLMVLLCALPTLLSMRAHSSLPTTFSLPFSDASLSSASSSSLGFSSFVPNEYDWSRSPGAGSMMDLDIDDKGRVTASLSTSSKPKKLEFVDSGALDGLSALDISFDASRSENGRIRVRIHPSSSTSTRSSSPEYTGNDDTPSMWGSDSGGSFGDAFAGSDSFGNRSPSTSGDPFLGVPTSNTEYGLGSYASDVSSLSRPMSVFEQEGDALSHLHSFGSELGKRRVRIALKCMPTAGSEGGEWEVQLC